jgi:hypothetical protein
MKTTYADGDVYSAQDVNDITGTINLLGQSVTTSAGKNAVLNGGFDIWQRGTSSTSTGYITADRWFLNRSSTGATFSQETTTVPAGSQFALKMAATSTTNLIAQQAIETKDSIRFAGQTVTLSGYFQASTTTGMTMQLQYSTSVDNPNAGSWTNITATSGGTGNAVTGSFTRITGTYAVPSTAKSLFIYITTTSTVVNGVNIFLGKVQLELGTTATTFSRSGGTIQGELAACQRYYQKSYPQGTTVPTNSSGGAEFHQGYTTLGQFFSCGQTRFPTVMRIAPTVTVYSSTSSTTSVISNANGTDLAASSGVPVGISDRMFSVQQQNAAGQAATGGGFIYHYAASAEL